jgi:hypothetical protein
MSDRIEELVVRDELAWSLIRGTLDAAAMSPSVRQSAVAAANDSRKYRSQLATIAREAEARALNWQVTTENTQKLLNEATADAAEWIDRCYQSEERALKAESMCEWLAGRLEDFDAVPSADTWLTAAREAVILGANL